MKKTIIKIVLDIMMLFLLVLMFNKRAISMSFHEIGGLVLFGFVVLHLILNINWITGVTKKLFDKTLPGKTRVSYIVNTLLVICMILVGISGIFISKVVFHFQIGTQIFKVIHYFSAALMLILFGIHIGLHKAYIFGIIKKHVHIQEKLCKIGGIILTIIVVIYGCYGLTSTSFIKWLSMPFQISQTQTGEHQEMNKSQLQEKDAEQNLEQKQSQHSDQGWGQGRGKENSGNNFNILSVLSTMAQFFSISYIFAVITVFFDRKKKKIVIAM